jgi:hypothetical protein
MPKPILCIDFDGVIHSYESGWQGGALYGTVVSGFFEWAAEAKEHFTLAIYSSRSGSYEGRKRMHEWLYRQWLRWGSGLATAIPPIWVSDPLQVAPDGGPPLRMDFVFVDTKPPAFLTIDDRAIQFEGKWSDPQLDPERLLQFKPWNQRS